MQSSTFVKAVLVLPVSNMRQSCEWYMTVLGFETVYVHDDPVEDPDGNYAILRRDDAELHLLREELPRHHPWMVAGTGYLFLVVHGVKNVIKDVQAKGITIARGLQKETWGVLAFQLLDPSGNLVLVSEEAK